MSRVYFTDRDLGNQFPDILAAAGVTVERFRNHFEPTCPDETWLEAAGRNGWVALTHNSRIRYTPNQVEAVFRHQVTLLVVLGKVPYADLARSFVATLPRIERFLDKEKPPLIAKIHRPPPAELLRRPNAPGSVELWLRR